MTALPIKLCLKPAGNSKCLLLFGHRGVHNARPSLWSEISDDPDGKTSKKIVKAGFATPRGGDKGGYQNHVSRSSRVILPREHLDKVSISNYEDGLVVRLTALQALQAYSESSLSDEGQSFSFRHPGGSAQAYILYRSPNDLSLFPPKPNWFPCEHWSGSSKVNRRTQDGQDRGHFLMRIPKEPSQGIAQGIFAPEYTDRLSNFVCQLALTYLAYLTLEHERDGTLDHIKLILDQLGWSLDDHWGTSGVVIDGVTTCPLCLRPIHKDELHQTIDPSLVPGLANSGVQLAETRSTLINLFHLRPLLYEKVLGHTPFNVAWGHAHCNTFLGQRAVYGWNQLTTKEATNNLRSSEDGSFLRSCDGKAWISVTPLQPGFESFTAAFGGYDSEDLAEDEDT